MQNQRIQADNNLVQLLEKQKQQVAIKQFLKDCIEDFLQMTEQQIKRAKLIGKNLQNLLVERGKTIAEFRAYLEIRIKDDINQRYSKTTHDVELANYLLNRLGFE